jgi:hypothetical protein
MIEDEFIKDLNEDNKLGSGMHLSSQYSTNIQSLSLCLQIIGGNLAAAYASLIKSMW